MLVLRLAQVAALDRGRSKAGHLGMEEASEPRSLSGAFARDILSIKNLKLKGILSFCEVGKLYVRTYKTGLSCISCHPQLINAV
jgi:hypothetical protein